MKDHIVLSNSYKIIAFLQTKRNQYISRLFDVRESEQNRKAALYKLCLVNALLNDGDAAFATMHIVLTRTTGTVDDHEYSEAWKVICDYNETGGLNVAQKTGQAVVVRR